MGRWKKINPNYGNMVLGYFGKTPVEPDAEVVKLASEQLGKPTFSDNPLDRLEPGVPKAEKILQDNDIPVTDENVFIIASCEEKGLDFLLGNAKASVRKEVAEPESEPVRIDVTRSVGSASGQTDYQVSFGERSYNLSVGSDQSAHLVSPSPAQPPPPLLSTEPVPVPVAKAVPPPPIIEPAATPQSTNAIAAQIPGKILKILISVGDQVQDHQTLMIMEAMKMETEIKAPTAGTVAAIHVSEGDAVQTAAALVSLS
jgi:pyruvate carboxylase subunit B